MRLNSRGQAVMGIAGGPISVEFPGESAPEIIADAEKTAAIPGGSAVWYTDDIVIFNGQIRPEENWRLVLYYMNDRKLGTVPDDPGGAHRIVASGGRYAAWLGGWGMYGSDARYRQPTMYPLDIGERGILAYRDYQSGLGFWLMNPDPTMRDYRVDNVYAYDLRIDALNRVSWKNDNGTLGLLGFPDGINSLPDVRVWTPVILRIGDEDWIFYGDQRMERFCGRPLNSYLGYVLSGPGELFYSPDVVLTPNGDVIAAWMRKQGELPDELRKIEVDLAAPRVDLRAPAPPPPPPHEPSILPPGRPLTRSYDMLRMAYGGAWPRGKDMDLHVDVSARRATWVKSGKGAFEAWDDEYVYLWEDHSDEAQYGYVLTPGRWYRREFGPGRDRFDVTAPAWKLTLNADRTYSLLRWWYRVVAEEVPGLLTPYGLLDVLRVTRTQIDQDGDPVSATRHETDLMAVGLGRIGWANGKDQIVWFPLPTPGLPRPLVPKPVLPFPPPAIPDEKYGPKPPPEELPDMFETGFRIGDHFLTAEKDSDQIVADRSWLRSWERFRVHMIDDTHCVIRTYHGTLVTIRENVPVDQAVVHLPVNRLASVFELINYGGKTALRYGIGRYIGARNGGGGGTYLSSAPAGPGLDELFQLTDGAPDGGGGGDGGGNIPAVEKLRRDRAIFRTASGAAWRWKGVDGYRLPQRWERGENVDAFLRWCRERGANTLRCFAQHKFMSWPEVDPYVMNLASVRPFVQWLADRGWYVELTVLADTQKRNPGDEVDGFDQSDQWCVDRVRDVIAAVRYEPNVFLELMNEPWFNGGVPRLAKIVNMVGLRDVANRPVLMSSGLYPSTGSEPASSLIPLDYVGDHPPRDDDWVAETGKTAVNQYKQLGVTIIQDEPMGAAEASVPGKRDADPDHWEDAGLGMALSGGGGTFHCEGGIHAIVPGPVQTECANRFFRAMDAVPADVPLWRWTHDGWADHPLRKIEEQYGVGGEEAAGIVGEVVARYEGGTAYAAALQPSSRWEPQARDGWTIEERRFDQRQNLLRLRK